MIDLESASDTDIVGRTLYAEARGEGTAGLEDVACVIMKRASIAKDYVAAHGRHHPLFGDGTPKSVCLAPWQFSCWNENDPNRDLILNLDDTNVAFNQCLGIAQQAIAGQIEDRTLGATHYRRIGTPANWASGHTPCFTEGHHEFFNDIN